MKVNAPLTCSCLAWSPLPEVQEGRFALKSREKKKAEKNKNSQKPVRHLIEMALE